MPALDNFPQDGNLWVIKWIDKVRIAHQATTSASISLLIQKLPISDPKQLHRLDPETLQEILSPPAAQNAVFATTTNLIGSLPAISIGAVYRNGHRVGQLPTETKDFEMPLGELSCESRRLDHEIPSFPDWNKSMPYRVLNKFEYTIDRTNFSQSHCIVYEAAGVEYIIPRSVIFKTYYAQNYKFAQAFTNGDWPTQSKTLIYTDQLDSGLWTGIDADSGEWNIVLQLDVPEELTPLLGIFYFDSYGFKRASSIYTSILQANRNSFKRDWFIDAQIPFETTPDTPLQLSVTGFKLKKYSLAPENAPDRFLVTRILQSSLPILPIINRSCFVNGQRGKTSSNADSPAPFSGQKEIKVATDQTTLSDQSDANKTLESTIVEEESFSFINPPEMRQMKKDSSKSYKTTERFPKTELPDTDRASPGNGTYKGSALPEAQTKMLIRDPDKRFDELIAVLQKLKKQRSILDFTIVPPILSSQKIEVGDLQCWNFLDEKSRLTGRGRRKGWRMKVDAKQNSGGTYSSTGQPRAALIIRIQFNKIVWGYWIEIQVRSSTYRSPYITNVKEDDFDLLGSAIEIIAQAKGNDLANVLDKRINKNSEIAVFNAYKHGYYKDNAGPLSGTVSADSVKKFLNKCHASHQLADTTNNHARALGLAYPA